MMDLIVKAITAIGAGVGLIMFGYFAGYNSRCKKKTSVSRINEKNKYPIVKSREGVYFYYVEETNSYFELIDQEKGALLYANWLMEPLCKPFKAPLKPL